MSHDISGQPRHCAGLYLRAGVCVPRIRKRTEAYFAKKSKPPALAIAHKFAIKYIAFDQDASCLCPTAQTNASIGTSYSFADQSLPSWALLGEYDNGSASGAGRVEYIWLPQDDGNAIPVAMFRGARYYQIHTDHLGTPRLIKDDSAKPVWQWAYSAFGDNKPTGILKATSNPNAALTNQPTLLQATGAMEFNLRFPGQYLDQETGQFYNYFRNYMPNQGRYTQSDPIGLSGGLNRFGYVEGNPLSFIDPFGLAGHHYVPRAVWINEDLPAETKAVFNRATTGPIPGGHNYGDGHRAYNDAVKEMWEKYKKTNPCEKMTAAEAQRFIDMVRSSNDPRIRQFLHRIYMKIVNGALRRIPGAKSGE